MSTDKIIFVDMDQVLADFDRAACTKFGVDVDKLNETRERDSWDILAPLSKAVNKDISEETFWNILTPTPEEGEKFWLSIQPLPWLQELVWLLDDSPFEWYVVSSPSNCHSSHSGKIKWLRKHIHSDFNNFILTCNKHLLSGPNRVLIDDRPYNAQQFNNYGGHAILFPAYGNILHFYVNNNPLFDVKNYLERKF